MARSLIARSLTGRRITPADLRHDGNSFTVLRWILASSVMISHAWDLTQYARGLDPTVAIIGFPISRLAVFLFFTLSGFLVTGSLYKRGVKAFLLARGLRLLPGLWVMLLVVPPVLWAAFGTIPFGDFIASPLTHRFVWRNALLLGQAYALPGLFELHSVAGVANGSLWTIPQEVRCYLLLAGAALIGLTQPRARITVVLLVFIAVQLAFPEYPVLRTLRRLAFSFGLGVLAWLWRDRLLLSWPLAIVLAGVALAVPADAALKLPLSQIGFGYLAIVAGFCVPAAVKAFSAYIPDYSYGIYIYAFPAQQAAAAMGETAPLANLALAFAMTVPAAALSWHFIEKPALRLKPAG